MSKKNSATKQGKRTIGAPPPAPPLPGPQPTSANTRTRGSGLGCSIAAIVLLVALVAGAALGAPRLLALLANGATAGGELTAGAAHDLLVEQQAPAIAQLTSYGWIDKEQGVAHIPIERAITLLASSDLPVGALAAVPQTESAATTGDGAIPANLNFTDHILPIFQDRCSECHGDNDPEEGLVLTSYKDVMLGSWYGAVVKPGDPAGSYLVELVETGQMPKKGDDLTPEQIALIVAWIAAGAPEFGSAESTGAAEGTTAAPAITPENVSFANDVLPIFQDRCSECHGDNDPEEGLVLTSYKDVMLGSVYGAVVKPNDPEGSYLVELITTGQMPKKGDDLSQTQIDTIIAWINAGAPDN